VTVPEEETPCWNSFAFVTEGKMPNLRKGHDESYFKYRVIIQLVSGDNIFYHNIFTSLIYALKWHVHGYYKS